VKHIKFSQTVSLDRPGLPRIKDGVGEFFLDAIIILKTFKTNIKIPDQKFWCGDPDW
jgi:hypothetical protein